MGLLCKKLNRFIAIFGIVVLSVACQESPLKIESKSSSSITGIASMFTGGLISFSTVSCSDTPTVSLHSVNSNGVIDSNVIASTDIMSDGSYTFYNIRSLGLDLQSTNVKYVIKASNCGYDFYRPFTGQTNQNITGGSTLVALTAKVDDNSKKTLPDLSKGEIDALITKLDDTGISSLTDLLNTLIITNTLKNPFQTLTNLDPSKIKDLPPDNLTLTAPTSVAEASSNTYNVVATTWNTDYTTAYEWKLNGNVVSTAATYTLTASKNWQGTYTLDLTVGSSNSGVVDMTKPVTTTSRQITVSNDFPAVPPSITLIGSYKRKTLPVSITMNTGTAMGNCDTFSSLALSTNYLVAPILSSDYNITCTSAGTQTINTTLSSGDGVKTLALWAMDSAGNISSTSSYITVMLDQTNPALTLGSIPSVVRGTSSTDVSWTASDATAGLQSVILEYSSDGGSTYTQVADLTNLTSPYSWQTPTTDVTGALLRITATDAAGNSTQVVSSSFNVDDSAPTVTITSPSANTPSQTTATISGACETGLTVTLSGDITTTTAPCSAGTYSETVTFAGTDGVKNIIASQTDAVGNVGSANRNLLKDTTPPSITFTSPDANTQAKTSLIITGTCETSGSTVTISGTGVNAPSSATCTAGAFTATITFSAVDGTKTVDIAQNDVAGNTGTATRDFVRNNAAPAMTLTGPPANTEAQTGVTLTGSCEDAYPVDVAGTGISNAGAFTCSGGLFSIPVTFTATDGTKAVSVSQTDSIFNTITVNRNFIKDSTAPVITITSPAANLHAQTGVTIQGACENGYAISVSGDLSNPSSAVTCSSGAYSYAVTFTANDATKNIVVTQTDAAGNIGTSNRDFIKDTDGPNAPVLTLLSSAISNSTSVSVGVTCDADFDAVMFSTSSSTPSVSDPSWATCAATKALTASTGDGTKTFYAFAKDTAGNITEVPSSISMILDQTNPMLSLTSLNTSQVLKGGSTTNITWSATDTNFGSNPISLSYSLNGGTSWTTIASAQTNSGTYSWTVPSLNSSNFKVRVTATDAAGNTQTAASSGTFTVDSTSPVLTLNNLNGGELLKGGSTVSVTWTATDANFGTNPIKLDYTTNNGSSWTSVATSQANSGTYSWVLPSIDSSNVKLRVTATDSAGNVATATSTSPFTIDSTIPSLTLTSLSGGQTIAGSGAVYAITWNASDTNFSSAPITIEYSSNSGGSWTTIVSGTSNTGSYNWTVSVADKTTYRIRIKAIDLVGWSKTVTSSADFAVDSNAPALTQTLRSSPYVSTGNTVTFGGSCDLLVARMGTSTDITVSGAENATVSCTGSAPTGTWTWTTSAQTTDAIRIYNFSQTALSGLTTTISPNWVRQTQPPQVSAVVINNGDTYLRTLLASAAVTASDPTYNVGLKVRIASADGAGANCQALYADDSWNDQVNTTMTWSTMVPDGDNYKKVCAWAKNAAGIVSTISPVGGSSGVNMNTIQYVNSSPPQITSFSVTNANDGSTKFVVGDLVKISWTATDALGLDNNPIKLEYTTDGLTWTTIESAYGNLSGNPTTYSTDYYGFTAPSNNFTRVRITAKNVTGQVSITTLSQALNGGQWSVFAGNKDRGVGGSATTVMLYKNYSMSGSYVINPKNNDMYLVDESNGVIKVDGKTGLTSTFLQHGSAISASFVDGAVFTPGVTKVNTTYFSMAFDSNGYLYLNATTVNGGAVATTSWTIWQLDLSTNIARKYLTGGTSGVKYDNTATPANVFVSAGQFTFDESNSLYFITSCTPGSWDTTLSTTTMRLMKVTQVNGQAGTVSVVAGNCASKGTPVNGTAATATPFSSYNTAMHAHSIAVWNNGNAIYYTVQGSGTIKPQKIINGIAYSTALPTLSTTLKSTAYLAYNPKSGKLYRTAVELQEWTPNLSGADGETYTTFVSSNGTGACAEDGVTANTGACVVASMTVDVTPQGKVIFSDGVSNSGGAIARVRYVDDFGKLRTLAGALGHYGEGKDKSLARSSFGGIYYKRSTEPNQSAFPEGLYFRSYSGPVFGRIETSGNMTTIWGNQQGNALSTFLSNGTLVSDDVSMGITDFASSYQFLAFDNSGLPWMGYQRYMVSLDSSKQIVNRITATSSSNAADWSYASPGSLTPISLSATYAGAQNLVVKNSNAVFFLGRTYDPPSFQNQDGMLRYLDFSANTLSHIMGNGTQTASPDSTSAGSVANFGFGSYTWRDYGAIQYDETDDAVYFSDNAMIRKLQSPNTPSSNYLTTIATTGGTVQNFIISLDKTQVFYIRSGALYCAPITAGGIKTWCNNTSLGPPTGLSTITKGPNQMTWKDSSTLLINTYTTPSEIYQYDVPTIP